MQKASSTVLAYADGYSTLEGDSTDMLGGTWQCGALEQDTVGGCEAVEYLGVESNGQEAVLGIPSFTYLLSHLLLTPLLIYL